MTNPLLLVRELDSRSGFGKPKQKLTPRRQRRAEAREKQRAAKAVV